MAQHKEEYFILPMLMVLYFRNEPTATEDIKKEIKKYCSLSNEDLLPYPSRNQKEPRYFQIVGNIISHNNINFFKYVRRIKQENNELKKSLPELFVLNENGIIFVRDNILNDEDDIDSTFYTDKNSLSGSEENVEISDCNKKVIEVFEKNGDFKKPVADQNLAKEVFQLTGYKCQVGVLLGEEHILFENKNGEPYLESHHLIPLKASKAFFPINLDIAANLVPLCPSCHAKLHHGSYDEKVVILRILYDKRIKSLNENGIFISFNDLLNNYYI